MKTRLGPFILPLVCHLAACGAALAQGTPASLAVEAQTPAMVTNGGPLRLEVTVRNTGSEAVPLGSSDALFGWLVVTVGREKAWFTDRIPLTPAAAWPASLAAGASLACRPVDAGAVNAYPYGRGLKLERGYPVAAGGAAPVVSGRLNAILPAGRVHARLLVCLPRPGGAEPLTARSAPLEIAVAAPAAVDGPAPAFDAEKLLRQFDRDPWSAQQAHDRAVKIGRPILSNLIAAASDQARPGFARLWLTTAVADIPARESVAALNGLLGDTEPDVRCVVAYYGPKQRDDALDGAIVMAAKEAHAVRFTSYALLGFLVFRGTAPDDLLQAGLESRDPRARDAAVRALATMANEDNVTHVKALLQDPDVRVRATARRVLDALQPEQKVKPATRDVMP